jgi:hypothetical protein
MSEGDSQVRKGRRKEGREVGREGRYSISPLELE